MKQVFFLYKTGHKIAFLFLCLLIGIVVAAILLNLILMIPAVSRGGEVSAIYVGAVLQSVFVTALPAYIIAVLTHSSPMRYLKLTGSKQMGEKIIFAILVFIFSYALTSFLAQWNKGMVLPSSMHEIEQLLRSMEDAALETTNLLLSGKTIDKLIFNLIIIGGFAAFSEELFFRGALQQIIQEKIANGHVAVWITALVFSIVHFQFYGFLPRLLLGALLGYLFLYTRNLWVPIIFHFINNASIVVLYFFWGESEWLTRMDELPVNARFLFVAGISALCTLFLFWFYQSRYYSPKIENRQNEKL